MWTRSREHARSLWGGMHFGKGKEADVFPDCEWFRRGNQSGAPVYVSELDEEIKPNVLRETPPVVTVGARTMSGDYSFVWPAGANPYFLTPGGKRIGLEVIEDIPYCEGDHLYAPRCRLPRMTLWPNARWRQKEALLKDVGARSHYLGWKRKSHQ